MDPDRRLAQRKVADPMQETETATPTTQLRETTTPGRWLLGAGGQLVRLSTAELQAVVDLAAQRGIAPTDYHPAPF